MALLTALLGVSAEPGIYPKKVYVLFSNHLDVGYTILEPNGSCAAAVVNQYFDHHIPQAIATANAFRNGTDRYKWMAHSWLASVYRNCPETIVNIEGGPQQTLHCPTKSQLADFDAAAKRGDITWHAFPFNAEPELMDPSLLDAALRLTFEQDALVGHARRITYSQRDVPGLTRAAIPLLARNGVQAVTVGENGACAPVNVPPVFVWRDEPSGTEVLAMFHPKGYGVTSQGARALHAFDDDDDDMGQHPSYVDQGPALRLDADDCITVGDVGLCFAWKGDNQGPHTPPEAREVYASVRQMYPRAEVVASDAFDDFVRDALPFKSTLPVVTAEIGDTWVHGADADPLRVALCVT